MTELPLLPTTIEHKVIAATITTSLISVALACANAAADDPSLLGGLPAWLQTVLLIMVPPLLTFIAAYRTPHTPRSALPEPPTTTTTD